MQFSWGMLGEVLGLNVASLASPPSWTQPVQPFTCGPWQPTPSPQPHTLGSLTAVGPLKNEVPALQFSCW